jgi:hypothetical protein
LGWDGGGHNSKLTKEKFCPPKNKNKNHQL